MTIRIPRSRWIICRGHGPHGRSRITRARARRDATCTRTHSRPRRTAHPHGTRHASSSTSRSAMMLHDTSDGASRTSELGSLSKAPSSLTSRTTCHTHAHMRSAHTDAKRGVTSSYATLTQSANMTMTALTAIIGIMLHNHGLSNHMASRPALRCAHRLLTSSETASATNSPRQASPAGQPQG